MNKTYEEILAGLKKAYFDECAEVPDPHSLTARRFEAVASEIFSLSCYGDYIFKQAFIQTACGDNLDKHGVLRNCRRKKAEPAGGILTFSIKEPSETQIIINAGTVCSVEKSPYLQFATTENGVIEAGRLSVDIPAESLGTGYDYNVDAKAITVMVNAPVGISSVTNNSAFSGGYDDESDSSYRERIMKNYSALPNGVNAQSIANSILMLDFVTDCYVAGVQNPGEISVIVSTKNHLLTDSQKEQIRRSVGIDELIGAVVHVECADVQNISVFVEAEVRFGFDKDEVKSVIEQTVSEVCSVCRIGRPLTLSKISKRLAVLSQLSSYNVYSRHAYGDIIPCNSNSYLYLNDLAVNCFDE